MEDADVDMLIGVLQMMDLSKGLIIMINSPGGDGLAAERIINVCRSYSGTGEYQVIVPGKAKSAATMVCFGASAIYMSPTSELGPVDPQIVIVDNEIRRIISAFHIVESYKALFAEATVTTGNLEPYLLQLGKYDASVIANYESDIDLSKDISIRALKSGMLSKCSEDEIEEKIKVFLTPAEGTKTHGRAIFRNQAINCELDIEELDTNSELWRLIYELYIRTNNFVSTETAKCIENSDIQFIASVP